MFFLWFWGRPGRSMGWAHMQSAHACAVETHFFVFAFVLKNRLHMTSFWLHFGTVFCQQSQFWVKKSSKKWLKKRWPPCRKRVPMNKPGGSRRQAHYQELFEQETIVRTHVEAIVRVFAWKCKLGWKLNSKSKIVPYKFHEIFKFQLLFKSRDLTRPGQRPGELID